MTIYGDLGTSQCPLCFHSVPHDGSPIIGECPNCKRDTSAAIFKIRYPVRTFIAGAIQLMFLVKVDFSHRDQFPT